MLRTQPSELDPVTAPPGTGQPAASASTSPGTRQARDRPARVLRHGTVVVGYGGDASGAAPGAQVGIDPRWAVRLPGVTTQEARWLQLVARRPDVPPLAQADRLGVAPARAREIWQTLEVAGALAPCDAPHPDAISAPGRGAADGRALGQVHADTGGGAVLARRARRAVGVVGLGRQGLAIALVLATAGVGRLHLADPGVVQVTDVGLGGYGLSDVGTPRETTARRLVTDVAPVRTPPRLEAESLDVVVLVDAWAIDARRATRLMEESVPHLSVLVGEAGVSIGPMVRPGATPCLRCVELHRSDTDDLWPTLSPVLRERARHESTDESTSATVAAGLAAAQVLAQLDDADRTGAERGSGRVVDVLLPAVLPRVREVTPHPRCGCGAHAGASGG